MDFMSWVQDRLVKICQSFYCLLQKVEETEKTIACLCQLSLRLTAIYTRVFTRKQVAPLKVIILSRM